MLYDTHSHPYLAKKKSQEVILERFFCGFQRYINSIGVDIPSSIASIELSKKNQGVFASIGVHPTSTPEYIGRLPETINSLQELYNQHSDNVIAIGEGGLDYYWLKSLSEKYNISENRLKNIQKEFFIAQIKLAQKLKLPLIIHNRESAQDIFQILQEEDFKNFVFHCYSENLEFAERLIDFAPKCKLGFGGVVTFKNASEVQKAAINIPLKNIIIETDAPYLTPVPYRGKEENEPLYCQYVLEKIIELRSENPQEIKKTIFENSINMFIKK